MNIRFEYQRAMRAAQQLEEIAGNLEKSAKSRLNTTIDNIHSSWEGENANSFQNKGRQLSEKLEKSIKDLRQTAETIRTIAQNMRNTEERAKETARINH